MPDNAVYVGRPTRWGNPYRVGDVNGFTGFDIKDAMDAVSVYAAELDHLRMYAPELFTRLVGEIRADLAGRDLACWCPLDQPCHADVLLEIANGGAS